MLFETALDAIAIADREGRYLDVNSAACKLFGLEKEALIGRRMAEFVSGDLPQVWQEVQGQVQAQVQAQVQEPEKARGEFRLIRSDGEIRFVEYAGQANFSPQGYLWVMRDITPAKQAESEIQELRQILAQTREQNPPKSPDRIRVKESECLEEIARHIPGVIYQLRRRPDGTYHFPYASEGLREVHGVSPEEVRFDATAAFQYIHPDDLSRVYQSITVSADRLTPWCCEYRTFFPDGRSLWLLGYANPKKAADGSITWYGCIHDITTHKATEMALQEVSRHWQLAIENAGDGTWDWNLKTNEAIFSQQWKSMLGYEDDEIGSSLREWETRLHPDDRARCYADISKYLNGETSSYHNEHRLLCKDGTYKWILARARVVEWDENGRPSRLVGTHCDISDRRMAEENLRASLKNLSDIKFALDRAAIVAITDVKGRIKYVNDKFCQISKFSRAELIGQDHRVLNSGYHPPEFFQNLWQTISQGQVWQGEIRNKAKDGTYYWMDTTIVPFLSEEGKITQYLAIRFDATSRKQAEAKIQSLLARAQRLHALTILIRNSLDLSTILTNAVRAIYAEIDVDICAFGWYREEENSPVLSVVTEQKKPDLPSWVKTYQMDEFPGLFDHILQGNIYQVDFRESSEDEAIKNFCQTSGVSAYLCLPIHTAGGEIGAIAMGRIDARSPWTQDNIELLQDVANQIAIAIYQSQLYRESQQKTEELALAYRELQQTQIKLIQAEKMSSLGELVAGIAHEINNPVNFIYGNLQPAANYATDLIQLVALYQKHYPQPPQEIADFQEAIDLEYMVSDFHNLLKSMNNGAVRISNIVKSLRTFSRLDEADLKKIDIHESLESTLVILQSRLNGRTGKPEIMLAKNYGELPLVKCYGGLLNQVFMNLLVNAIDAIEDRRSSLEPAQQLDYVGWITITTCIMSENQVLISIRDNGLGMSPAVQAKIFDPFFTTKPVGKGTGMGLAISYQIITEYHHGNLRCISTLGKGTEFVIELPMR
jgi:PAS domain S-box-containing protein